MPIPTCQHTMSVTRSGPFTIGPISSPSDTSSHQRGSAPRRSSIWRSYCTSIASISSSVYGENSMASYLPRSRAFSRSVRIIRRYWPERIVPSSVRNTLALHSWMARFANSLSLSSTATERVAAQHPVVGAQRRPPLARARRVEGVHPAQRVALHQVALVLGDAA